jgi:hypothetical protein
MRVVPTLEPLWVNPTAVHDDGDRQVIPSGRPDGLETADHFDPFHCSSALPTARQNEGEVHETPVSWEPVLGTVLQEVPFHCRMKYLGYAFPMATQNEADVQETPLK